MSTGFSCKCAERKKPIEDREWEITQYMCNHSAFNGYHRTPSDYSTVVCHGKNEDGTTCTGCGRTKANYVIDLWLRGKYHEGKKK